jgi:hypothetical protein
MASIVLRPVRVLVAVALALAGATAGACGPEVDGLVINRPYGAPAASTSTASAAPLPTWSAYAFVAPPYGSTSWKKANARRFNSAGHFFGRYDADILVNDAGYSAYVGLAPGRALPVGAIVAKVHYLMNAENPGPVLAMEKREDGMNYVEMDSGGHVLRSGRLHPCVDCHTQVASQDELFGVPTTGR